MSRSQDEQAPATAPPRYKLALVTWAGAYAVITAILAVLGPAMAPWPLPLRTLLLSVLMVTALTWVVTPSLTRLFRDWLAPSHAQESPPPAGRKCRRDRRRGRARSAAMVPAGRKKTLAWLVLPLVLVAAVAGCGGGGGAANTSGDREERTTTAESAEPSTEPSAQPSREERLVSALRGGGYVMFLRHTATDWAQDDELPVDLSDCETQRNLSDAGRSQARAMGEAFEQLDIPIGRVLSSPFCRTLDTAQLAFGRAQIEAALENPETAESEAERELRNDGLRRLLSTPPGGGTNTVLSGHGWSIEAVADVTTEEGDAYLFRPEGGGFALVATLTPADWEELAERFGGDG
jgi:phosphohistidine phosphatase SixA